MTLLDQIRADKLAELARARFNEELWESERKVLANSANSSSPELPPRDAPRPDIRSEFVRWLATDPEAALNIDPRGVTIRGATLKGNLDLNGCGSLPALDLRRCTIQGSINLHSAETQGLYLLECDLAGELQADRLVVHGPVFIRRTTCSEQVRLLGARIRDDLDLSGTRFEFDEIALNLDGAKIDGHCILMLGFESAGGIRLTNMQIGGNFNCEKAVLKNKAIALNLSGARVDGACFFRNGFESAGQVMMRGVQIGNNFESEEAAFNGPDVSLDLNGARIGASCFMKSGFKSAGEVRMRHVEIAGTLQMDGAKLQGSGMSLDLNGAGIGSACLMRFGFEASGTLAINSAHIGGSLELNGARLTSKLKLALNLSRARIDGSVALRDGFESLGEITLMNAWVGGAVIIYIATVAKIDCTGIEVEGDFVWLGIKNPDAAYLNLTDATVKTLHDEWMSWDWPAIEGGSRGNLELGGLVYEGLTRHEALTKSHIEDKRRPPELLLKAKDRIAWLMLQPPDRRIEPQPWMRLRDLLEKKGDHKGAKHVLFRLSRLQAANSRRPLRWARIAFAWLEEAPIRILCPITLTLAAGTLVFTGAAPGRSGAMVPNTKDQFDPGAKVAMDHYPPFQPFVYTLENALPLVKLGMDDKWVPDPQHIPRPPWPGYPPLDGLKWTNSYCFLAASRWLLILSGWFQATVLAAALSGRFKQ